MADDDIDLTSSDEDPEPEPEPEPSTGAAAVGATNAAAGAPHAKSPPGTDPRRGFKAGEPVQPSKQQLIRSQVRRMVRIQLQLLRKPEVTDEWIDGLFDEFDTDRSGFIDDTEWDNLVKVLEVRAPEKSPEKSPAPRAPSPVWQQATETAQQNAQARSSQPPAPAPPSAPAPAPPPPLHVQQAAEDAGVLFKALNVPDVTSTDARTLGKIIVARTDAELQAIKSAYSKKYYRTLTGRINKNREGLEGAHRGAYRDFLLQRLSKRDESSPPDKPLAQVQAKQMVEATEFFAPQTFVEILGSASLVQMAAIKAAYQFSAELTARLEPSQQRAHDPELSDLIKEKLGDTCDLGWALQLLMVYCPDPASLSLSEDEDQPQGSGGRPQLVRQLNVLQVRAMVRVQLQLDGHSAESIEGASDEWIDGIFYKFDSDGSGLIDNGEWAEMVEMLQTRSPPVSRERVAQIQRTHADNEQRLSKTVATLRAELSSMTQAYQELSAAKVAADARARGGRVQHQREMLLQEELLASTTQSMEARADRAEGAARATLAETKEALEAELREARQSSDRLHVRHVQESAGKDATIRFLREKVDTQAELTSRYHAQIGTLKTESEQLEHRWNMLEEDLEVEQGVSVGLRGKLADEQAGKGEVEVALAAEQAALHTVQAQQEELASDLYQSNADATDREERIAGLEAEVASISKRRDDQKSEARQVNERNTVLLTENSTLRGMIDQMQADLNMKTRTYYLLKGTRFASSPISSPTSGSTMAMAMAISKATTPSTTKDTREMEMDRSPEEMDMLAADDDDDDFESEPI